MTSNSPLTTSFEGFCTFLSGSILPPLVIWLKNNKQIDVTTQELIDALQLPSSGHRGRILPPSNNQTNGIQVSNAPYLRGTGATLGSASDSKGKTARGRKKPASETKGPNCIYVFQRNKREGQVCNRETEVHPDGLAYCTECRKKAFVRQLVAKRLKELDPVRDTVPLIKYQDSLSEVEPEQESGPDLEVIPYPGRDGWFIEPKNQFLLHALANGGAVAVKVIEKDSERDLTDDEIEIAKSLHLAFIKKEIDRYRDDIYLDPNAILF